MKVNKKSGLFKKFLGVFLMVVIVVAIINHQMISDFVRGWFYSPSLEMLRVREKLSLTEKGELIFNASWPEFNDEVDFNANCLSYNEEEAILGCYKGQRIYVYSIDSNELKGITELATAHELLHAVYERTSKIEKNNLRVLLEGVYKTNQEALKKEIEIYSDDERIEELYVRIGTEIKKLPEELEKHYAEIFKDQDRIVDFYESYIGVFRRLEAEFKALKVAMKELKSQIDIKSAKYKIRTEQLNNKIYEFNSCANQIGCFSSQDEFNIKRNEILANQAELKSFYDEIDGLINQYNLDVEKYNNNIIRSEKLQNIINSHVIVEGI